jgi:hypothetical protein
VCAIRALGEAADPEAEARAWLDELRSPSPPAGEGKGGGAGRAGAGDP